LPDPLKQVTKNKQLVNRNQERNLRAEETLVRSLRNRPRRSCSSEWRWASASSSHLSSSYASSGGFAVGWWVHTHLGRSSQQTMTTRDPAQLTQPTERTILKAYSTYCSVPYPP